MSGKTFDDVRAKCDCPAVITGFLDKSSKSERFLALAISHEHSREAALFLVRSKDLTITHVVPIYAGVHLKVEGMSWSVPGYARSPPLPQPSMHPSWNRMG